MKKSDFYFDLPEELIAQTPLERRDASRLLTLDKTTGAVAHHHFYELPQFLRPNDCLVLNDSRVLPARLLGHRVHVAPAEPSALLGTQDADVVLLDLRLPDMSGTEVLKKLREKDKRVKIVVLTACDSDEPASSSTEPIVRKMLRACSATSSGSVIVV